MFFFFNFAKIKTDYDSLPMERNIGVVCYKTH